MSRPTPPRIDIDQFVRRLLVDSMIEATKQYWLDRARTFEDARSRVGDYTGLATDAQIADQDARLGAIAQACRNAASLCEYDDYRDVVRAQLKDVMQEAA